MKEAQSFYILGDSTFECKEFLERFFKKKERLHLDYPIRPLLYFFANNSPIENPMPMNCFF